jgi:hypothetical protein
MRFFILGLTAFMSSVSFAARHSIPDYCAENAASFVEHKYGDNYDREGFEGLNCKRSPVGRAIECTVAASKGNGAAIDTYRVILNTRCSNYYRIDLVGEE